MRPNNTGNWVIITRVFKATTDDKVSIVTTFEFQQKPAGFDVINYIASIIYFMQYMGLCVFTLPISGLNLFYLQVKNSR